MTFLPECGAETSNKDFEIWHILKVTRVEVCIHLHIITGDSRSSSSHNINITC